MDFIYFRSPKKLYTEPLTSCSISCLHLRKHSSNTATSVSVTCRGAGLQRTSDKGQGEGVSLVTLIGVAVGEPDIGVFISTSESSSFPEGGVLCTNLRVLSRTS